MLGTCIHNLFVFLAYIDTDYGYAHSLKTFTRRTEAQQGRETSAAALHFIVARLLFTSVMFAYFQ